MEKYVILIHGQNLLTDISGVSQKVGFFTNVFVEALSLNDAELRALDLVRDNERLGEIHLNQGDDPLLLTVEEGREVESLGEHELGKLQFMFYPETQADPDPGEEG